MSAVTDPVQRAWQQSFLAMLPLSAQKELLATAHEEEIRPDQNVYREVLEPRFSFLALVMSGMLRSYVTSSGDRRIAARYWGPGQVVGLTSVLLHGASSGVEAVRRGSLLRLDPKTMERLGRTDANVAWATAQELARRLAEGAANRVPHAFGSVRVRVAWHLLKLAVSIDGQRVVRATQQELADSVGSVREVVARVLLALCDEGILAREGALLVVRDPVRLESLAGGERTGAQSNGGR
ncbi:Crp/Fnr family transcriptional regulator [Streptomyces malaysiensis]|uniref:Crp/Fnr family transcriptional regulator n=1 Tax=Streptomyces malaysiensis TaxID=92644 RepID=A0A7X5XA65_STRMQ|nr:Crp/Fnr family transcriptional regulator [Streptomyces malaysiensis]NIY69423.1 Crp/Fnr family transcriptional regulator [Streptomyces malaysiensis]